jgi:hypothetical protein
MGNVNCGKYKIVADSSCRSKYIIIYYIQTIRDNFIQEIWIKEKKVYGAGCI